MTERISAGWYRDPFGRHEKRYHTGTGWTEHVKNKGKPGVDPPSGPMSAEPPRRFPERIPTRVRRPGEAAPGVAKPKPAAKAKPAAPRKPAVQAKPAPKPTPVAKKPIPVAKTAPVIKADHEIKAVPVVKATPAKQPAPAAKSAPVPHKPTPGHKKPVPVAKSTPVQKSTPSAKPTPVRAPVPVRTNGAVRAGMPAASKSAVAVAPARPVNKRAPSSYLKPAPHVTAAPVPEHRPRWPWVVVSIFVLLGFAFASGVGLIDSSATEPRTAPAPLPSRTAHTINQVQYDFVIEGTTRDRVVAGLGRKPADRADYLRIFPGAKTLSSCVYYYGKAITRSYSFCFDRDDLLIAKTARTLPTKSPKPGTDATSKAKAKATDSKSDARTDAKSGSKAETKAGVKAESKSKPEEREAAKR